MFYCVRYTPAQAPVPGKGRLFGSRDKMVTDLKKFVSRVKRTAPPAGACAYVEAMEAGEFKIRWGMQVWRPVFHSSSNESNHSRLTTVITANNAEGVLATALYNMAVPGINNSAGKAHGDLVEDTDRPDIAARVNQHHLDSPGLFGGVATVPYQHLPTVAGPKTAEQADDVLGMRIDHRFDIESKRAVKNTAVALPPPLPAVVLSVGDIQLRQANAPTMTSCTAVLEADDLKVFTADILSAVGSAGQDVGKAAAAVADVCARCRGSTAAETAAETAAQNSGSADKATAGASVTPRKRSRSPPPAEHSPLAKMAKTLGSVWAGFGAMAGSKATAGSKANATSAAAAPVFLAGPAPPALALPAAAKRKGKNCPYPCTCKEDTSTAPCLPAWKDINGATSKAGRPRHTRTCLRERWIKGTLALKPVEGDVFDVVIDVLPNQPQGQRHGHRYVYAANTRGSGTWKGWKVAQP